MQTTQTYAQRMASASQNRAPQQPRRRMQQRKAPPQRKAPQRPAPQRQAPPQGQWNPQSILNNRQQFAKVRKVLSGDTVRLESLEHFEYMVTLDGILAPRCSRTKSDSGDDAFGYESREFLRKMLIGAYVIVEFTNPEDMANLTPEPDGRLKRVFGFVYVVPAHPQGPVKLETHGNLGMWRKVTEMIVENGFASTKNNLREDDPNTGTLRQLEEQARQQGLGKFAGSNREDREIVAAHTRMVDWEPNVRSLFNQFKGKPINGIIEEVREGSTLKVELIMPTQGQGIQTRMIWLAMSGIQCPPMPKPKVVQRREYDQRKQRGESVGPFQYEAPSQIATSAKRFVERRLLHQDVTVTLEHLDTNQMALYGSVSFPRGDIGRYLLSMGFGYVVDWHVNPANKDAYVASQEAAKQQAKGIWAQTDQNVQRFRPRKKVVAEVNKWVCTQVYNGDCLILTDSTKDPKTTDKKELNKRVYLASLKCPKTANNRTNEPAEDYAYEAREFVRSRLVGQPITVRTQYNRTGTRGKENLEYVSITYGDRKDISTELVKAGLADIVQHSKKDPRVENYLQLNNIRDDMKTKKVGMWSDAPYTRKKLIDLTLSGRRGDPSHDSRETHIRKKAIQYMNELGLGGNVQRATREDRRRRREQKDGGKMSAPISAVVEYVFTSTRMKVRLVEKNMYIILLFAGIQGIRGQDLDAKTRQLGEETTEWVRRRVQQQEVFVAIENLDKHSNFVGHLLIKENGRKVNLGVELLKLGAARVFEPSAERSPLFQRLINAQEDAKEKKLGLWENFVESVEEEVEVQESNQSQQKKENSRYQHAAEGKTLNATLTHVESATEFYVADTTSENYKKVDNYMNSVNPQNNQIQENWAPKAKDRVAGLYDGQYYRCSISSISRKTQPATFFVNFLDFGNRGKLPETQILPIIRGNGDGKSVAEMAPLAVKCRLAGLKPPPVKNEDYVFAAGQFVSEKLYNRQIEAKVLRVTRQRKQEVFEIEATVDGENVNETMVSSGWARLDSGNFNIFGGGRRKEECPFPEYRNRLQELADTAQKGHIGMYVYGTVDSDDEDN